MTQILEDLENHPKEVKRVLALTDKQFKKIIENAQNLEENKKNAIPSRSARATHMKRESLKHKND